MRLISILAAAILCNMTVANATNDIEAQSDAGKKWFDLHGEELANGITIMTGAFWCRFRGSEWLERKALEFGNHLKMNTDSDIALDKSTLDDIIGGANNVAMDSYLTNRGNFCGKINDLLPKFENNFSQ